MTGALLLQRHVAKRLKGFLSSPQPNPAPAKHRGSRVGRPSLVHTCRWTPPIDYSLRRSKSVVESLSQLMHEASK